MLGDALFDFVDVGRREGGAALKIMGMDGPFLSILVVKR